MRFRRFMAIACGLATMGAMGSGDLFNFTLFVSLVGIANIGIVAAVKSRHVLDAAYEYGIVAMVATLPLFGGRGPGRCDHRHARDTGPCGRRLCGPAGGESLPRPRCHRRGGDGAVLRGEGRDVPGAGAPPYVIMCSLSSLLIFLRVVEIVITI